MFFIPYPWDQSPFNGYQLEGSISKFILIAYGPSSSDPMPPEAGRLISKLSLQPRISGYTAERSFADSQNTQLSLIFSLIHQI